ncbi:hypothetical protein SAMN05446589_3195 [Streptomyces sp. OV198]|uniref:hypothetical protein n=1 Tax=unclassified Streptomyces TaxID=2593676 RepID=UPI000BCF10FD|nr:MULTISPECIES: hypothetical protein [unclassified Streptomyces]PBC96622.1 hypothetical protein BX281_4622 [Streptomyces sp. Ag82_O1-15]SOE68036.1 hypothetical protein SAMN05446589_3195 [Streptomyces sp. OV198]
MPGTLRATSEGRPRRAVARTAAVLAAVASVALAGCAVPGAPEKALAGPPASVPPTERTAPDPAGPTPLGTSARPRTPEPTPTPPPRDPAPASSPSPSAPTVSPTTKLRDLRTPPPSTSPRPGTTPAKPSPKPSAGAETFGRRGPDGSTTLRIGSWSARVVRGGQEAVDACRDAVQWTGPDLGTEDGYALRTAVVVGHDYCGFERFAKLPVGTVVTATTPRGTFEYRVYAHYVSPGRGTPSQGLYWGDLTLQSCVGPDTGFSYLMRV